MIKIAIIVISVAILGVSSAQQFTNPDPFVHAYGNIPLLPQHYRNAEYYKNLPHQYHQNSDYYKSFPNHYENVDYYKNLTQYHNLPPHLRHPDYYKNLPQHYQNADYYKNFPHHYQNVDYYQSLNKYHNLPPHLRPADHYKNLPQYQHYADYYKNLPQYYKNHEYYRTAERSAPIVRYDSDLREDGSYDYSYETGNGIAAQESGVQRPVPPVGELATVAQGSYSYTSPEGVPVSISYVADENGYRAVGDVLPTPPPVPPQIQRSLEFNAAQERALPTYPTAPPVL